MSLATFLQIVRMVFYITCYVEAWRNCPIIFVFCTMLSKSDMLLPWCITSRLNEQLDYGVARSPWSRFIHTCTYVIIPSCFNDDFISYDQFGGYLYISRRRIPYRCTCFIIAYSGLFIHFFYFIWFVLFMVFFLLSLVFFVHDF